MEEDGGTRRPLVVLTSSPFHGIMTPTLQLATTLHANGFPIAIAHTHLNPPNPSNLPSEFTFLLLSANLPAMDDSGSFTNFLNALNNNCKASFKEHLTRLISKGKNWIVIIYDNVMSFAGDVARDMNLAAIMLRTTSAAYLLAFLARQQLRQQSRFLEQDFVLEEVLPDHHPIRYKDLPFSKSPIEEWRQIFAVLSQYGDPSAVIMNTVKFDVKVRLRKLESDNGYGFGPMTRFRGI